MAFPSVKLFIVMVQQTHSAPNCTIFSAWAVGSAQENMDTFSIIINKFNYKSDLVTNFKMDVYQGVKLGF